MNLIRESRVVARHTAPSDGVAGGVSGASAELLVQAPCGSCASPCLLGSSGERRLHVDVPEGWHLALGERVELAVDRAQLTRLCAFIFGAPLAALVVGALLGTWLWGEFGGVLLALVMVAGATLGVVANRWSLRDWAKLELIALRRVSEPSPR